MLTPRITYTNLCIINHSNLLITMVSQLEAAIKAAHEATHQANEERRRWQEKSELLLTEHRRNEAKERQLMQTAKDLEELTQVLYLFKTYL